MNIPRNETGATDTEVPVRSNRLYLELDASKVAMFKFLLEGYDNLSYFTVADKRRAVLKIVYAPGARQALEKALQAISGEIRFKVLPGFPTP
ncbi:MAG: DUF4911 domain-containing protein [Desulfovibrio sp.]|uniref:DUF4911 domain-containing protein n=1 Tax=Desulfovibrio sp. 7SRBS1 TaxID=3378064 RepID=UPI003B3C2B62